MSTGKKILTQILKEWEIPKSYLSASGYQFETLEEVFDDFGDIDKVRFEDRKIIFKLKSKVLLQDADTKEDAGSFQEVSLDPTIADSIGVSAWKKEFKDVDTNPVKQHRAVYELLRLFDVNIKNNGAMLAGTVGKQISNGDQENLLLVGAITFLF